MDKKQSHQTMGEQIKTLLEQNLELNQEIYKIVKDIQKFIMWQKIFGGLKILLIIFIIIVPIILGLIYLPPFVKNFTEQYQGILKEIQGSNQQFQKLESLSPTVLEMLKSK